MKLLSKAVLGNFDFLMVFESYIDMPFLTSQFVIQGFAKFLDFSDLDKTNTGGRALFYIGIPFKLLNISYVSSDTECLLVKVNL